MKILTMGMIAIALMVQMGVGAGGHTGISAYAQEAKIKRKSIRMSDLHRATFYNDTAKMQALIDKGADVNVRASRKVTPLHMAAHEGHVEAATLLINSGANALALNAQQETALDVAIRKGHADLVDYFYSVNKSDETPLGYTPAPGSAEVK